MQIKIWHLSSSTQNSTVIDESESSLLLFDILSTTFSQLVTTYSLDRKNFFLNFIIIIYWDMRGFN